MNSKFREVLSFWLVWIKLYLLPSSARSAVLELLKELAAADVNHATKAH
jgi:hypothetical protein